MLSSYMVSASHDVVMATPISHDDDVDDEEREQYPGSSGAVEAIL